MLYHHISLVSIYGLHGTLYVQRAADAEGISVQTEGPYEVKVVDDSWLRIYPEGQNPPIPRRSYTDVLVGGSHLGSVDVTANVQHLIESGPRTIARPLARVKTRVQGTVRITAPPDTKFELISCHGLRKGPRGWRSMRGSSRFDTR
jgi:hypothetical protein